MRKVVRSIFKFHAFRRLLSVAFLVFVDAVALSLGVLVPAYLAGVGGIVTTYLPVVLVVGLALFAAHDLYDRAARQTEPRSAPRGGAVVGGAPRHRLGGLPRERVRAGRRPAHRAHRARGERGSEAPLRAGDRVDLPPRLLPDTDARDRGEGRPGASGPRPRRLALGLQACRRVGSLRGQSGSAARAEDARRDRGPQRHPRRGRTARGRRVPGLASLRTFAQGEAPGRPGGRHPAQEQARPLGVQGCAPLRGRLPASGQHTRGDSNASWTSRVRCSA